MKINYELIGAFPEVEMLDVDVAFELYSTTLLGAEFKQEIKEAISQYAMHFYGMCIDECSVLEMVDKIHGVEQSIELV